MNCGDNRIGITERGDAALDKSWEWWVLDNKPAILISKDPFKLYQMLLRVIIRKGEKGWKPNVIVHCTITGWGGTIIESHVPSVQKAFEGFLDLVNLLGKDRVVLRIDPIIPTKQGIEIAMNVKGLMGRYTNRTRISFMDNYEHVKRRFSNAGISPLPYRLHAELEQRLRIWEQLGKPEVCGEPGMTCTGCISEFDCKTLSVVPSPDSKYQRPACHCLANKKELLLTKPPCYHGCLYCYWGN